MHETDPDTGKYTSTNTSAGEIIEQIIIVA
jgi:hypothetical protein